MKNYPVVRTDKMSGTDNRVDLYSARYYDGNDTVAEINNGCVVKLGALESTVTPAWTSREIYKATDVAANTPLDEVVLVASPEVVYDERLRDLDDYTNEAGKAIRVYSLGKKGQMFGLTANGFDGTPAKGKVVELKAGNKLAVVSSATANTTTVGVIDAVENAGKYTYYVVRVTG